MRARESGDGMERMEAMRRAVGAMFELHELAERCIRLHEAAEIQVPEALARFVGRSPRLPTHPETEAEAGVEVVRQVEP